MQVHLAHMIVFGNNRMDCSLLDHAPPKPRRNGSAVQDGKNIQMSNSVGVDLVACPPFPPRPQSSRNLPGNRKRSTWALNPAPTPVVPWGLPVPTPVPFGPFRWISYGIKSQTMATTKNNLFYFSYNLLKTNNKTRDNCYKIL